MTTSPTRGERNFNPGNIRCSDQTFLGEIVPSQDAEFKQFQDFVHGVRAIAKILLTYYRRHGINTVRMIVNRWAPPSENDTEAYIDDVCLSTGLKSYDQFRVDDRQDLILVVQALIKHENGKVVCTREEIEQGVDMALGRQV